MDDSMDDHSAVNTAAGRVAVNDTWLRDDHRIILYTLVSLVLVLGGHRTWREYHRYRENAARRAKILRLVESSRREKERERKLGAGSAVSAEAVDSPPAIHVAASVDGNASTHDERSAEFAGNPNVPRASSSKSLSSSTSANDLKARPENATNLKRPRDRRRRGRDMYKEGIKQERKKSSASSSSLAPNSVSRHMEPSSMPLIQATSGSDADASRSRSHSRSGSHSRVRSDSASRSRSYLRARHEEVDEAEVEENGTSEDTPKPGAEAETALSQPDLTPPETTIGPTVQCACDAFENAPNITSATTMTALTTNIKCRTPTPPLIYSGPSSNSSVSGKISDSGLSFSSSTSVSALKSALGRAGSPVLQSFNLDFDLGVNLERHGPRVEKEKRTPSYDVDAATISQPVPGAPNGEEQRPAWLEPDSEDELGPCQSQRDEDDIADGRHTEVSVQGFTHAPKTPSSSSLASLGGVSDSSASIGVSNCTSSIHGGSKNSEEHPSTSRTTSISTLTAGTGSGLNGRRKATKNRSGSPQPPRFRSLSRPSGSGASFVRGSPFHSNGLPLPMLPLTSLSAGVSPSSTPPPFTAGQREGASYRFALETAKRREAEQRKEAERYKTELERLRNRWNEDVERGRRRETELQTQLQLVTSQMHAFSMAVSQMHPHPFLAHPPAQCHNVNPTNQQQQQSTPSSSTFPVYPPLPILPLSSAPGAGPLPESGAGPGAASYPGSGPGSPYAPGTAQSYPYPHPYPYPYLYPYALVATPPHLLPRSMSRSVSGSGSASGSRSGSARGSDSARGSTSGSGKASPVQEHQYALAPADHVSSDFLNLNFGYGDAGEEKESLGEWASRGPFDDRGSNSPEEDAADTSMEVGVSSELVEAILKRPSSINVSHGVGGTPPSAPVPASIRSWSGSARSASGSSTKNTGAVASSRVVEGRATSGDEGFRFASLSELGNPLPHRRSEEEKEEEQGWVVYDTDVVANQKNGVNGLGEESIPMVMSPEEVPCTSESVIFDGAESGDGRECEEYPG